MVFRIARHTNNIEEVTWFYKNILNFEVLGSFNNHDNYDGVFFWWKRLELAFTTSNEKAEHVFDDDDLLVFYPTTFISYNFIIKNIKKVNVVIYKAKKSFF